MTVSFDFIAACKPGMAMRTRDRSEATNAPGGAAGPLDLMPPEAAAEARQRKTISLRDALDPTNRSFCCD